MADKFATDRHLHVQGFELPARKGIADFLQEVTSHKDQAQYWARTTQPYEFVPVEAFARAFKGTDIGQRNARHLEQPYERPPDQLFDPLVRKKCALLLAHLDLYIHMDVGKEHVSAYGICCVHLDVSISGGCVHVFYLQELG